MRLSPAAEFLLKAAADPPQTGTGFGGMQLDGAEEPGEENKTDWGGVLSNGAMGLMGLNWLAPKALPAVWSGVKGLFGAGGAGATGAGATGAGATGAGGAGATGAGAAGGSSGFGGMAAAAGPWIAGIAGGLGINWLGHKLMGTGFMSHRPDEPGKWVRLDNGMLSYQRDSQQPAQAQPAAGASPQPTTPQAPKPANFYNHPASTNPPRPGAPPSNMSAPGGNAPMNWSGGGAPNSNPAGGPKPPVWPGVGQTGPNLGAANAFHSKVENIPLPKAPAMGGPKPAQAPLHKTSAIAFLMKRAFGPDTNVAPPKRLDQGMGVTFQRPTQLMNQNIQANGPQLLQKGWLEKAMPTVSSLAYLPMMFMGRGGGGAAPGAAPPAAPPVPRM